MTTFKCSKRFSAWSLEYETGKETKKHNQERYLSPVILMNNEMTRSWYSSENSEEDVPLLKARNIITGT